jgi:hypothetical protein
MYARKTVQKIPKIYSFIQKIGKEGLKLQNVVVQRSQKSDHVCGHLWSTTFLDNQLTFNQTSCHDRKEVMTKVTGSKRESHENGRVLSLP